MNSYSILQIILYIIACILGAVAIIPKLFTENKTNRLDKISLIGIILTLGLSILLEVIRNENDKKEQNKQIIQHKEYIDSLSSILSKSNLALQKSDSTLESQLRLFKKNDSILNISNQTFKETQNVLLSTTDVIRNQNNQLADFDREKNPLFPMQITITLRIPFNHESLANTLPKILAYKKCFEQGKKCDSNNLRVNWIGNKEGVYSIRFFKFEKLLTDDYFMDRKSIHLRLQTRNPTSYNSIWVDSCLFDGTISEGFDGTITSSYMDVDFEYQLVYISLIADGLNLSSPKNNNLVGITDLINNYLVIIPSNCSYDLYSVEFHVGKGPLLDIVNIYPSNKDIIRVNKTCKFYSHKITRNEILKSNRLSNYR